MIQDNGKKWQEKKKLDSKNSRNSHIKMSNKKNKATSSELDQKKLCQLYPEIGNILVVAIIISKTEPNIFLSKNDTEYKGVMTFTLRDTKEHFVNCKVWGSRDKVEEYNETLRIGDIIDVICPRVSAINVKTDSTESQEARYQPVSTLPFALVLNEGSGHLQKHNIHDLERYGDLKQLRNQSHKPLYSVMNLSDVKSSFTNAKAQIFHTDFLVVVGLLKTAREIRSDKDNRVRHCLELMVFDQSLPSGMPMTIWHEEWIKRAQQFWQPMKMVLHLIDAKVSYSDFYKGCLLSFTSRSIIYENPMGQETKCLQEYAASIPKTPFEMFAQTNVDSLPKADEIQTIMTVRQIYSRAEGELRDNSEQFTAVLFGAVTHFNVDIRSQTISKRCKACNRLIQNSHTVCDNEQCQLTFSLNYSGDTFEYFFNINIRISDHTGTMAEARLTDETASRLLGLTTSDYLKCTDKELEKLKSIYMLNHFKVKLLIKKATMLRRNMVVLVIDMQSIDLEELAKNIAVF